MRKSTRGFSIVELLVIIVVVGILAGIAIVSYNGIQKNARNADRYQQVKSWAKLFDLYRSKYGSFPNVPNKDSYCLGENFPNGKCREYKTSGSNMYLESDATALMTEIKKIGSVPTVNPVPVSDWVVGPYANYWGTGLYITQIYEGGPDDCPEDMDYNWDNGNGMLICGLLVD